jgi:hypothetical protein
MQNNNPSYNVFVVLVKVCLSILMIFLNFYIRVLFLPRKKLKNSRICIRLLFHINVHCWKKTGGIKFRFSVSWKGKLGRCMVWNSDGTVYCRKVHYGYENPNPMFYGLKKFPLTHVKEAMHIFQELKLLTKISHYKDYDPDNQHHALDNQNQPWKILNSKLIEGTYVYPASKYEHFSPINPLLFSIVKSSCNIKAYNWYMSRYFLGIS